MSLEFLFNFHLDVCHSSRTAQGDVTQAAQRRESVNVTQAAQRRETDACSMFISSTSCKGPEACSHDEGDNEADAAGNAVGFPNILVPASFTLPPSDS